MYVKTAPFENGYFSLNIIAFTYFADPSRVVTIKKAQ